MEAINSTLVSSAPSIGLDLMTILASARFYISSGGIFVSLFAMGCVISIKDFADKDTHLSKSVVIGIAFQSLVQPLIGYGLALLLDMGEHEALAMIILACSPVSPLCAVLVYYGDGVVIVGMCLAMFSTALSVGLIPLWFSTYAASWTHEYFIIGRPLTIVLAELLLLVPTALGVLYKKIYGKLKGKRMAKICSNAFWVVAFITPILNGITNPGYYALNWRIWVGAVSLPPIGFVCGTIFALSASLPFNVCCAVSLAVGMPNVYIASQFAHIYLAEDAETVHDVDGLLTIFSLVMPLEGFVWAIMYRGIEDFFLKATPKCCIGDDEDDDEKKLVADAETPGNM